MTREELLKAWDTEICQKQELIDPENEQDWNSMFIGFALGKGFSIEEATDYDLYYEAFQYE